MIFVDDLDIFSLENIKFFSQGLTDEKLLDVKYLDGDKYVYSLTPKAIIVLDIDL